jgi:hypothetical protein
MRVDKKELQRTIAMAMADHWENGLPVVPAKLRLAINSLKDQAHGVLPQDSVVLIALLQKKQNSGVRKILRNKKVTPEAFAFALRDALS